MSALISAKAISWLPFATRVIGSSGGAASSTVGEKEQRFRSFQAPVEREFDGGLRSGGPSSDERERCREQIGGSAYPFEIEEAHGLPYSLYRSSAPPSPGRIRG
jgi:hypothetical protein